MINWYSVEERLCKMKVGYLLEGDCLDILLTVGENILNIIICYFCSYLIRKKIFRWEIVKCFIIIYFELIID